MKIAVVATGLDHIKRGVESWAATMASALASRSCDVTLFKGSGAVRHPYEQVVPCLPRHARSNDRVLAITSRLGGWRYGLGDDYGIEQFTASIPLLKALRRGLYDVVHTQDALLAWLLQKASRAGGHRSKVIFANGTNEPMRVMSGMEYVQELSPPYFCEHARVRDPRRLFLVPNSVDTTRFAPGDSTAAKQRLGLPADVPVVLSVGAINQRRKRMDWLIQEFAALQHSNARLVIAGAIEDESEKLIRWGGDLLGDRLLILGNRDHAEMPAIYQAADVFVLCAIDEVFGIAFLEAMASGVPCIGHHYDVTRWIIADTGVTVDMTKPNDLSVTLQRLFDEDRLSELGRRARARACEVFSDDIVIKETLDMYRQVVRGGKAA